MIVFCYLIMEIVDIPEDLSPYTGNVSEQFEHNNEQWTMNIKIWWQQAKQAFQFRCDFIIIVIIIYNVNQCSFRILLILDSNFSDNSLHYIIVFISNKNPYKITVL